ncbi:uncharacterized protein LOC128870327 [Anastrepha ludens]|uniref:uncharacterized protein LOC128870327 n=1 Tax=Anastrepha ludens TaxID=28586 RepID=UPI0023B03EB9|nr:uncharacterized protein LOC128870327 [Anastrepha ludens]
MSMQNGESNLQVTKPTSREQRAIARAKRSATEEIDLLEENIKEKFEVDDEVFLDATNDETSENKIKAEMTEIGDLIKLLTLKFQKEEEQQKTKQAAISTENVDSVIGDFDGQSPVRVESWFENFEKCAAALKWSDNQKYVFARKKMTKTAKLFVDSICVFDYDTLRKEVEREFRRDFVSADIHKQLQERRKKSTEIEQQQNMQKTVQINNIKVRCLIDSGAEISIIEQTVAKKLNCSLKKCSDSLSGYGNKKLLGRTRQFV